MNIFLRFFMLLLLSAMTIGLISCGDDEPNSDSNPFSDEQNSSTKITTAIYTVNGVSFKMIAVERGSFTMGATVEQGNDYFDEELPTHKVTLSSFAIGEKEVTQLLWQAVMGTNPTYS